jgi:hypothetical protein
MEFVSSSSAIARAMVRGIANGGVECVTKAPPSYECAHCSKVFGEVRAKRQHQNFVPSEDKAFGLFLDDLLLSSEPQYHQL